MESASAARLWDLPYGQRVATIRSEVDRITSRLDELGVSQLDHPAVGDWTIRSVVAHLTQVAGLYTDSIGRGASGDLGASSDLPQPGTGRGALVADGLRQRAASVAEALEATVVEVLRSKGMALADALDADELSLEFDCYHPGGIIPANRFGVLFLKELGLHEWDMFEALEPPCEMSRWGVDAAIQGMEEELASGSLRWLTDPDVSTDTLAIRVVTSGEIVVERDLLLEPNQTRLVAVDSRREVASTLKIGASDFVLGCSGRLDLVDLVNGGGAEGNGDDLRAFTRRLTGM